MPALRIGIVGAGWAGLAAACEAVLAGHEVRVWDMAPRPGGRARSGIRAGAATVPGLPADLDLDCGQHVLIGAYTTTLGLLRRLGVDEPSVLTRLPLALVDPQGHGLRLTPGPSPALSFLKALGSHDGWTWREKGAVLRTLVAWRLAGFRCDPSTTVATLCRQLPERVVAEWIEPLCVAALNTPARLASGRVFLRVLADGLFAGPGGSDLLVPRHTLHDILPGPACGFLQAAGARLMWRHRVRRIEPDRAGWRVDGEPVDRLVVATTAPEAARLLAPWDPGWSAAADALPFEPIVTTWVHSPGSRLSAPMVRLPDLPASVHPHGGPAQFAFDLGAVGHPWSGGFAFVSSAAGPWLDDGGLASLEAGVLRQAQQTPGLHWATPPQVVLSVAERRATLRCEPTLGRPSARVAPAQGKVAVAGDYVEGPYPSTLEGAVRSGVAAVQIVLNS